MSVKIEKIFTISFICLFAFASSYIAKAQDDLSLRLKSKPVGVIYQKNRSQKGSELLFDTWNTGEIILSNGNIIENLDLNFNAYSNDLFYAINGNTAVVVSKYQYSGFKIYSENKCHAFVKITDSIFGVSADNPILLEEVHSSKIKAYANRKFKVNSNLMKSNPFGQSVYYLEESYYVIIDGKLISSPQSMRSYYEIYGKALIKQIVRSNNIDLKDEDGMVKFFRILDEIE